MKVENAMKALCCSFAALGRVPSAICFVAAGLLRAGAVAATPQPTDFGYGHLGMWDSPAVGTRPLVILLAQFDGIPGTLKTIPEYDRLFFGPTNSVNEYFKAVSNGRFQWTRAGVLGGVHLSSAMSLKYLDKVADPCRPGKDNDDRVYSSNIVAQVLAANAGSFNIASYDANHDHNITPNELQILIVTSEWESREGAGIRWCAPVVLPWAGVMISNAVCAHPVIWNGARQDFATICHELCHELGADDLYPPTCCNQDMTVMGCTLSDPDDPHRMYPDPWHRMVFGWCEPRIFPLTGSGTAVLPVATSGEPTSPVLLWDPNNPSLSDFWLLEYRNPQLGEYDRSVPGTGLALWYVQQNSDHNLVILADGKRMNWNMGPYGPDYPWPPPNSTLWGSGTTTDLLTHTGPLGRTAYRVRVHEFQSGDSSITVEWFPEVWVDFAYAGLIEAGTFSAPFNTFAEGVAASSPGGVVHVKAGSTPERLVLRKRLTLRSYGGTAMIGR